jgi:Trk K+ transport system NAD-binding subunit/Kef-type K+ transport system membrane component KefB
MQNLESTLVLLGGFTIVAVAANQIARFFQRLKLPLITGLLVIGLFSGPFIFKLLPEGTGSGLQFINDISLAFIAFAAAAELYVKDMRSRFKSIKWMTFGQLGVTFIVSALLIFFLADRIAFMSTMDTPTKVAVAILMGTIFVARSPASAIAVINEMRAKGPFVQMAMGVTVIKDFLVILLFAICFSISVTLVSGEPFTVWFLLILLGELIVSFGLGYVVGRLLAVILSIRMAEYAKAVLILALGYGVYALNHYIEFHSPEWFGKVIHIEPLLICIIGSFFVTNYSRFRQEFIRILEDVGPIVYICFFTLTGASVSLDVLIRLIGVAFLLFGIRLVTMIIGSFIGGSLAGDPPLYRRIGWMPFVTQAGVGLGLATVVANAFPAWGNEFQTTVVAVIVINQFVGPPLFKWSINLVGEARLRANTPGFDGIRDAYIIGFESQSVALARQLKEHGWEAEIITNKEEVDGSEFPDITIRKVKDFTLDSLEAEDIQKAEAVVLTLTDKENLRIAEDLYEHVGTKDIVVRLNDRENFEAFHELNCLIVDPSTAMVSLMDHLVRSPQAATLLLGMQEDQDTMDVEVMNQDLRGLPLRDLRLPQDIIILSITRGGQTLITHGYTRLRIGDVLTIVGSNDSLQEVALKFDR